jgi:hypothetical protein
MTTHEEIERRFGYYSGPRNGWTDSEIRGMYLTGLISRDTAIRYHQMTQWIHRPTRWLAV